MRKHQVDQSQSTKDNDGDRYKRAAVSEVSGIRLLDGVPVIEGKVIKRGSAAALDNLAFLLEKVK